MANGSFGSNKDRIIVTEPESKRNRQQRATGRWAFLSDIRDRLSFISAQRWVDIIFGLIFLVSGIAIACNWSEFSDALFYNLLFPVIYIGSRLLFIIIVIAIIAGIVSFRFRRRRYW